MSQSAYDDVTGVEEDPKHPDTPDSPRPGLGHLRAPRTHSPASDPESYRALVAVPGRAPLQVSRAQQGSTGYPPHNYNHKIVRLPAVLLSSYTRPSRCRFVFLLAPPQKQ